MENQGEELESYYVYVRNVFDRKLTELRDRSNHCFTPYELAHELNRQRDLLESLRTELLSGFLSK